VAYGLGTDGCEGASVRRAVSDSDTVRRQNRGLVLDALRRLGPLPRTQLAGETGLSHATITAITSDMVGQSLLSELVEASPDLKSRGRPAIRIGFNRQAGYALLIEIDVNKARCSLIDYGGTLVDRVETLLTPESFAETSPTEFLNAHITNMQRRNPDTAPRMMRIALSVQGILDRDGKSLKWSPVQHFAGDNLVAGLQERFNLPVVLFKRGRLLAEGMHWLFPEMHTANTATVFVGATIAMGISLHGQSGWREGDTATEFGHMNHIPNGALCRCGMLGCIEAYASDYGLLRSAYGVPDKTPPALAVPANQYAKLITRAQQGDREVIHAFNLAGNAIGTGISRLMAAFDLTHILIVGPGARAFPFIRQEMEASIAASLTARVHGIPQIMTHEDESEPIFKGLMMKALVSLDQDDFAGLPATSLSMVP